MNGSDSFDLLAAEIRGCAKCSLSQTRLQALPSESQPQARILLIGESPGATEDRVGRNFCGPSGKFLDYCLKYAGLTRRDVNVSPILHCHPPGNRNPLPEEARACLPYLNRHLTLMNPALIMVMGGVAARWFLKEKSISSIAGTWREWEGRPLLVTFHPAAGMRFPQRRQAMLRHFRELGEKARQMRILQDTNE